MMFTFSNFQFIPNCPKQCHLKKSVLNIVAYEFYLTCITFVSFKSKLDTRVICLQWHVSQCVQIWIFNITNQDSFTKSIHLWYKYHSMWICVFSSFQYNYYNYVTLSVLSCTFCITRLSINCHKLILKAPLLEKAVGCFINRWVIKCHCTCKGHH